MKVAIPVEHQSTEDHVYPSFGRTPFFMIYDEKFKDIKYLVNEAAHAAGGAGIKAAQLLVDNSVDVVITPRCGKNAAEVLQDASINIYKSEGDGVQFNMENFTEGGLNQLNTFHEGFHGHGGNR